MTTPDQPMSVPADAVLAIVESQRNVLHTELAKAQVLIEQQAAEIARLTGETPVVQGQVSGARSPLSAPAASPR
jgi:hypothetical protein